MSDDDKRTEEVITSITRYLSLLRYSYSNQEKLSRMKVLNDYYKSLNKNSTEEIFVSNIHFAEQLSSELILPLKVKGVFLTEGRHKVKYYKRDVLEASTHNPINASFPLMLDHKDNEAGSVIGRVTKIEYDDSIGGIRWWGHVNDENHARNVMDGSIKDVSATIFSSTEYDDELGVVADDLVFKELSFCMGAADSNAFVEVDNSAV